MLGICIIGVTGYAVDALLLFVQRKILWWKPAE
jgi:NitT/TauT family transport system permease protein